MIKLAICDDDCGIVEEIETFIERAKEFSINYEVFYSAEELMKYELGDNKEQFDVFFLDIEMKKMSGLEAAKKIRNNNPHAILIFLTSYTEYVYDVFEVITFDFIVKPLTFEKFKEITNRDDSTEVIVVKDNEMVWNSYIYTKMEMDDGTIQEGVFFSGFRQGWDWPVSDAHTRSIYEKELELAVCEFTIVVQ